MFDIHLVSLMEIVLLIMLQPLKCWKRESCLGYKAFSCVSVVTRHVLFLSLESVLEPMTLFIFLLFTHILMFISFFSQSFRLPVCILKYLKFGGFLLLNFLFYFY